MEQFNIIWDINNQKLRLFKGAEAIGYRLYKEVMKFNREDLDKYYDEIKKLTDETVIDFFEKLENEHYVIHGYV